MVTLRRLTVFDCLRCLSCLQLFMAACNAALWETYQTNDGNGTRQSQNVSSFSVWFWVPGYGLVSCLFTCSPFEGTVALRLHPTPFSLTYVLWLAQGFLCRPLVLPLTPNPTAKN